MELSSKSQSTTAQVFGYSGLSICVLNDSLLIRSLLSLSLVRTILNSLISLTRYCYDWHPGSRCGWTCNQLTSKVDGRHNWKSAQVVNSHLVCDPTIQQQSFGLPRQQWSLLNRFCMEQGHCGACRRELRLALQTLICVLVARPRRCPTLSNPVFWRNWMAAYLGYTLQMKTLFPGWLIMVHDTHTRRRRTVLWQEGNLHSHRPPCEYLSQYFSGGN